MSFDIVRVVRRISVSFANEQYIRAVA